MSFPSLWVCYTWLAKSVIFIWDKSVLVNLWEGKCWFVIVWVTMLNTKQWGIKSASSWKVNTQVWHTGVSSVHLLSFVCIWAHSQRSACTPALCWPRQTGVHMVWSAWHVTSKRAVQLPGCTRFQVVPRYWINENSVYQKQFDLFLLGGPAWDAQMVPTGACPGAPGTAAAFSILGAGYAGLSQLLQGICWTQAAQKHQLNQIIFRISSVSVHIWLFIAWCCVCQARGPDCVWGYDW